jgi:hypothetical protein
MTKPTPITRKTHAGKSWTRFSSYNFASKDTLVPLAGAEIAKAATSMPTAFVKQQNRFFLVAVLSLTPDTNLFVAPDGRWLGGYVPSVFRGYPFQLAKVEGRDNLVLCVNEASGLVNEDKTAGEPFFDDSGELARPVKEVGDFLQHVEQNRAATNLAVASLAEAGIITQWPLSMQEGGKKPATPLYRIDEAGLNRLGNEAFLKLRKALPIAYAQLLSMNHIQTLTKIATTGKQVEPKTDQGLIAIIGDDDIISFQ